ncbi:hypothetical protein [Leeuwenhoekiella blandensis]|uniref:Uncharacterized protein n=1 Tax=Leeuwenhoekiella blandensis (strain CECT 7118 / CCUG 51940 / KCTC 22103 / MED217) TaxID=398720 RepID=A3XPV2_LEEBM|nr:hypothetical protein [Leeuwenhoekiella blandensis]EAQ48419.1 hypothetical protein MED217_12969 [Leeuwenhoekiella blandensis MED217]
MMMNEEDFKISTYKGELNYLFIIGCLIDFKFKSFRRFIIYLLHYGSLIDLRETPLDKLTDEDLLLHFENLFPVPIPRKIICQCLGINSRTTFNKLFGKYLEENNLSGRRSFSLYETYQLLRFWQGEGKWGRLKATSKKRIATVLHNGNYERTAEELTGALGETYSSSNKFSPRQLKKVCDHLDLTEESADEIEALIGHNEFQKSLLWVFGFAITYDFFVNNQDYDNSTSKNQFL